MTRIADLRRRVRGIDHGVVWVCQCCALSHANGECCADDSHGGDGIAPWSAWDDRYRPTMGLLASEHHDECPVHIADDHNAAECDCERDTFSTSRCQGCGSSLDGDRWAFTIWREPRQFVSGYRATFGDAEDDEDDE